MSAAAVGRWEFSAIGTRWQIDTAVALSAQARNRVERTIDQFDRDWSRFRDDSLVSALARVPGRVAAPADTDALLDLYRELDAATHGAVNPLIGDILDRRGYGPGYTLVDRGATPARPWQQIVRWGEGALSLAEAATLDVGAIGKGRLVDLVVAVVRGEVSGPLTVDASGDIAVHGHSERIALEHPFDPARAIGTWTVQDRSLCASAVGRRAWGDGLHHVLDARTGHPVRTVAATWAVAPDTLVADAAATALFFDGGPEFAHHRGVEWVRMTTDGRLEWSPDCKAELFS
ncbi:FAD:protein FMN transferase [Microbacterium sp. TNHR37B]|uniref:FAD:protein FMN transferase n=1 Tax=Microbacterium sp. TNHR37B TaxID=1775956 RepID=UPI0007B1C774|nr:FAD:protein FMN transferase [Microbacterium sp. TNHR37B]KZE91394.1 hypothetical protein AVP41_00935 [Microbacterium sp. TNHR37B]